MYRRHRLIPLVVLVALPLSVRAQDPVMPTPEEYAERAERAENAPLFRSDEPIRMTLRTDIAWLRDVRSDSTEVEGTLTFIDVDGSEVTKPVDTRARGNFRRNKTNCNFPPLRLDFPTGQMEGTVFEGQDKLKLVTPCQDGRDQYQNYIFDEYLAYKVQQIVTPLSFRVRLVEITYEDINGRYDTRTKVAFLIEDEDAMAERNRATMEPTNQFHPARMYGPQAVIVAMFSYMIGNTDWSPVYFHNSTLLRTEDGRFMTVPYDFDFSGVVNARYATVDPSLSGKITRVTQRLFRGFCRDELVHASVTAVFGPKRAEIEALYPAFAGRGFEHFAADDAKNALEYYEDFWKVIDDPREFQNKIVRNCRSWD